MWGFNVFVNVVKVMFGFCGCNVVIEKLWGFFIVIKDGVIVVKEVEFEDKFVNMGV